MRIKKDTWLFTNRPVRFYCWLLLALLVVPAHAQVGDATAIRRVELLETTEAALPASTPDWRPFVLPDQKPLDRIEAGNGMTNIRFRAREIRGEAAWLANPAGRGCRFQLTLALNPD
jgi:hypothetical protein